MKTIATILGMFVVLTLKAWAGDWDFYGSARVSTFETNTDNAAVADTEDFALALQSNSRIGAKVSVSDELSGVFEYGAASNVNLRLLYGEWDFGAGKFLVGQTYAPMNWFYSNQVYGVDNNLNGQGFIYSGREPMLRLSFGNLQMALLNPDKNDLGTGFTAEAGMPAFEASYSFTFDSITLEVAGGYNSYELIDSGTVYDVDSYVIALGSKFVFGPVFLNAAVFTGENAGNLIAVSVDGDNAWDDGYASISGGQVRDNDCIGYGLVVGYKYNDMFVFEAGYGYAETDLESAVSEDSAEAYYVNATVNLVPGVFFVPEIGRFDGKETGDVETTYVGAKWQINF